MTNIALNLANVRDDVARYAREFGRDPASIRIVAVSKMRPATDITHALDAGQTDFGENYLQEALPKIDAIGADRACWHFIGRVQSNKTRELATHFDWVQTVDRERVAIRLNEQRPDHLPRLNVCLQVNIDRETQKAGLDPDSVAATARIVAQLPRLHLRGLMAIPFVAPDFTSQHDSFLRVRALYDRLRDDGLALDTLSLGMSGDLRAAIAAGSTMVRVGTAIFGERR